MSSNDVVVAICYSASECKTCHRHRLLLINAAEQLEKELRRYIGVACGRMSVCSPDVIAITESVKAVFFPVDFFGVFIRMLEAHRHAGRIDAAIVDLHREVSL